VQTLSTLVELEPIEVPELALDDFQQRVWEGLHLEFFLARGRLILTPHLAPLSTVEASPGELERLETILEEKQEKIEQLKRHLLYDLSMYSALLETNSYHLAVNDHRVIARFLPYEPRAFEVKLYTQPPGDPIERYGDRIYLGRDRLPLASSERPHLGLGYLRRSVPEQVEKLRTRVARHTTPELVSLFEQEFEGDLAELAVDFAARADAVLSSFPAQIASSALSRERLLELNRAFREIKHVLAEAESVVRELEERLLAARSDAARYATKLRKDLTNDVNFIMMKVNGRISDAVNGIRI
jgi:hypothetical protein